MAKESRGEAAAKKVQRAAKTAGQRDKSFVDRMGFASIVALVCVLGIGLVSFAKVSRASDVPEENQDEWFAAYAIWDCSADDGAGAYLPPFDAVVDPDGIHPDPDGLIAINPFYGSSDGGEATMSVFFESAGIEAVDDGIKLADGTELTSGVKCGDETAAFEIRKWAFPWEVETGDPQVFTADFGAIPFGNDGEVYQFVLAPADADVPPVPQDRLAALGAASPDISSLNPNVTESDTGTDSTEPDTGTDSTEPDTGTDSTEPDTGTDSTEPDTDTDGGADTGTDSGTDGESDTETDDGADAGTDDGTDADTDDGADDAGADAGTDDGADAGADESE